jgi:hypothetical protein
MNRKVFTIKTKTAGELTIYIETLLTLTKESRYACMLYQYTNNDYTEAIFQLVLYHQNPRWSAVEKALRDATNIPIVLRDPTFTEAKMFIYKGDLNDN